MKNWKRYNLFNQNILAASTMKSSNYYNNFSLAIHTGDNISSVLANRDVFLDNVNGYKVVTSKQTHSNKIINIDKYELNNRWTELTVEADGMICTKKGVALAILTADCLAILACDEKNSVIGAVHAGWRGTKQEIVKKLIFKMQERGAMVDNIKCVIAPGICKDCYEVGTDVVDNFVKYPQAITKKIDNKWLFDNKIVNIEQLKEVGILEKNIEASDFCTSCNNNNFFSYRRGDIKGRFITFIALKPESDN